MRKRNLKILSILTCLATASSIYFNVAVGKAEVANAATAVASINSTPLGPVTSKDVIYQVITDRFSDGDTTNNIPSSKELFDDKNNDGKGDGADLKLYQGGDFQGIINKIPYLKGMGVTAVWISAPYENRDTPIYDKQADGSTNTWTSFHGYHASNYFTTNKHFGTMLDFARLRDELHKNNMKLVIDFVTNHSSRQKNPTMNNIAEDGKVYEPDKDANGNYVFDVNGEPVDINKDGKLENLLADPNNDTKNFFHNKGDRGTDSSVYGYRYKDLGSLADYNQENPLVINQLEKASLFWKQKGIDGIRHDATLHMNPAFVKGLKDAVDSDSTGPITQFGEFFIGRPSDKYDEFKSYPDRTGVNNLDFEYYRSLNSTFGDFTKPMSDFASMLGYTESGYSYENQAVTFMDNHDVSRFGYLQKNQKVYNAALVALLSSRGIPNIYYGTEQYITPADGSDVAGRVFMEKSSAFDTTTTAYKAISKMSALRKENDALAYGTTEVLYSNDDVIVMKRKYYDKQVIVAINRQPDKSVTVSSSVLAGIPNGQYTDYLGGLCGGKTLNVTNGVLQGGAFTLAGGEVSVWSYNPTLSGAKIGDVVSTMGRAGNLVYIYGENLDGTVGVKFGTTSATVVSNNSGLITAKVPNTTPGPVDITVTKNGVTSNAFRYTVLSGDQNQVIFHVRANTNYGDSIHIVGNIPELGNWDSNKCTEGMLNPSYPEWILPVSVPAGKTIEFKFIKKDSTGKAVWESGVNRVITSSSDAQGVIDTPIYDWSN
ncbi:alpha-amylase family glycosyl hydrolase [Clostridium manihotivorum]|uniref:Alpha-amylase n=1 Tax=Clostridium manihotivorum TaxID=2320868 RepID=A0A410E0C0_9CLOT|nr:alpha-amylase family glycosyl hydrolase [Clostridium manihotivorum]QAA34787.1 alpha-amylase [Clostridium manihotivorum]